MHANDEGSVRTVLCMLSLAVLACTHDVTGPAADAGLLPVELRFIAQAHGPGDNGMQIDCEIDAYITLDGRVERDVRVVQIGSGGGDARRAIQKDENTTVSFWAEVYFPNLQFHLIGPDSVEIRSPESEAVTDSRFWHEFALFAGNRREATLGPGELAAGGWTCHPMDTPPSSGEYYDAVGSRVGTWVLTTR